MAGNLEIVYGVHAVKAMLKNAPERICMMHVSKERELDYAELIKLADDKNIKVKLAPARSWQNNFIDAVKQGIFLEITALSETLNESNIPSLLENCKRPALILILDGITDPHNFGACLRTADAAGVDFVIINKDRAASITPVVRKVASGAAETVPVVRVTNLVRAIEVLKQAGVWIYGAAGEASQSLYQLDLKTNIAIVMGAEGSGLRRLTREHCDGLFAIPMLGSVESLNVSVATAVGLFEVVRQRMV